MRFLRLLSVVVAIAVVFGTVSVCAADAPTGSKPVTNYGEKPVAYFDHDLYKAQECGSCHHNEGDGEYRCGECHKLEAGEASKIKDAFHGKDKGACYACHLLKGAEKRMKCAECHKE